MMRRRGEGETLGQKRRVCSCGEGDGDRGDIEGE